MFIITLLFQASTKPVVFSTGLYGMIPSRFYSSIIPDDSVILFNNLLNRQKFESLCDDYECDKLSLIAHSSIDVGILGSHRLEKALLIDPATPPALSLSGIYPVTVHPRAQVDVILTMLYDTFVTYPFQPHIVNSNVIQLDFGGHSDMLDGALPQLANMMGIRSDTENVYKYKHYLKSYIESWINP